MKENLCKFFKCVWVRTPALDAGCNKAYKCKRCGEIIYKSN